MAHPHGQLSRSSTGLASLLALVLAGCGSKAPAPDVNPSVTQLTHRGFPIATGPHAVDCAACHGSSSSFSQFACVGCHFPAPTDAVHTTTTGYLFDSQACLKCHVDPTTHPYDHQGVTLCAGCHQAKAFYAALPVAGFTHTAIGSSDCSACHATASWLNASAPAGILSDPGAAVAVNALIPSYSGTSIVRLSPQVESLPMGMDHATTEVNMVGLACTVCHANANSGVYYPGLLHSPLANLAQPPPVACRDCHATSVPTGFVGPTAAHPARTPASGEMKHDAVAWSSAGAATTTRLVTADCGTCHLSPVAQLAATWRTGTSGSSPALYHAALTAAGLPQPTSCLDCHANSRPASTVSASTASLPAGLSFDHLGAGALGDCAACHSGAAAWSGGRFHLAGSTTPTSCLPCHAGQRPTSASGWASTSYTGSPFDYGTNTAGITHGDGRDCAGCHAGPGTGGAWGGSEAFTGGHFTHGSSTVSATTCIACHMSQRPDLVLGTAQAAAKLSGFDHSASGTGDCIGCHQATVAAGSFVNWYAPGGGFPGGDWKGAYSYPGDQLVSASNQFITVTELTLVRPSAGALVTGTTSVQDTLYNAMLHTSAQIPAPLSPGPASAPDQTTCWHCHVHDATGAVTTFLDGQFHPALAGYSATVGGTVTPLAQPTAGCTDCHAQMRPPGVVELAASDLQPMDHAALFTGTVSIGGRSVSGVPGLDCSTCHHSPGTSWSDGRFHANIGAAVPADCTACHYPLMADAPRADLASGVSYAMAHRSTQLHFQACTTCHTSASSSVGSAPYQSTDWRPGAYHASLPAQPTGCIDCHAVSMPPGPGPTQSSWSYQLVTGGTTSNAGQWMNHGAASMAGLDCAACHATDAASSGSAWSRATLLHATIPSPAACQGCHGLTNGGGAVIGTSNNLPVGLTSSSTLTTAAADTNTGVPAGTYDQITHADANASGHDCNFCHTQVGRSSVAGIQGAEWAKARFHGSFSAAAPLLLNGTTGRCSNCHLNVKPGPSFTAQDHSSFTGVAGTQDCSACHSWPGTGGASAPNWLGGGSVPQYITVGGFSIPQPPATVATTQAGIASLPHPTITSTTACTTCHAGGVGGKQAKGYDHASALINAACSACHEAGSNLVGTAWNGTTTESAGAGDTRPFTLASVLAQKGGIGGDKCTVTTPNHFFPVQCGQCHASPAGTGAVTTGSSYARAWYFPHQTANMTNPGTCNLCHTGTTCPKG